LSRSASVAKPIDYMLRRWDRFTRFIDDGRICFTNDAAERALRGFALGRKSWLFAGSERGADRAAAMATLIMTAKLNDVDPLALARRRARPHCPPQKRSESGGLIAAGNVVTRVYPDLHLASSAASSSAGELRRSAASRIDAGCLRATIEAALPS
jgi:hypothetical protein